MKKLLTAYLTAILLPQNLEAEDSLPELLRKAERVLHESKTDFINAAKSANEVFAVAHALQKNGETKESLIYFEHGLRLSPWNLEEQLAYADLKKQRGDEKGALSVAAMVLARAESDDLAKKALHLLGKPTLALPKLWKNEPQEGVWLCFVRIGDVDNIVLTESVERISKTLGLPTRIAEDKLGLPMPTRSALQRFVQKQLIPNISWSHPAADRLLKSLGKSVPEEVEPKLLLKSLIEQFKRAGMVNEADNLQRDLLFYTKCDQQWKSSVLQDIVSEWAKAPSETMSAIVIGITQADLYEDNVNYLFGTALTGARRAVVSTSRFRADLAGEPPDRKRLVARLHRQLLSSIGNSLNIPRPTDPTSARAYPASVPEQDAKSEYMSEECIRGFERVLGYSLPTEAHAPELRELLPSK